MTTRVTKHVTAYGAVNLLPSYTGAVARAAEDKFLETLSIKDFGAGVIGALDDSPAINLAIEAATTAPYKKLTVPPGTYMLNGARTGMNAAILILISNLTMVGCGRDSVFKVADGYTAGGDYRVMAPFDTTSNINNINISGIHFDGNGQNNLVLGSSGGDIRRAYTVNILKGQNIKIRKCFVSNNPGRNVFNIGNNANPPSCTNVEIAFNEITDVGGAIVGNELQNDHSSIYCQATDALIHANRFANTVQPSPSSPGKAVVALEIHGSNTTVSKNRVKNYTGGGNAVASVHDSENNQWINNRFIGMTGNIITLWSFGGFKNKGLVFRGNTLGIDNSTYTGGNAFYQGPTTLSTSTPLEDLVIEDNRITASVYAQQAITWHGILLCSANNASIRRNKFRNIQGSAIVLSEADANIGFDNVEIEKNSFIDCGIHSSATSLWGVYITNTSTAKVFNDIKIRKNHTSRTTQGVGVTPFLCRGYRVVGGGALSNIVYEGNTFNNIVRTLRYSFVTTTNNVNVGVIATPQQYLRTADPVSGQFDNGFEYVIHNNPVASGFFGRLPVTSGSCVAGTWAASTAYVAGAWIKTSGNKVLICQTSGTSDTVEPNPTTLGIHLQDGTATWVYIDTVVAVFKTFGAISA